MSQPAPTLTPEQLEQVAFQLGLRSNRIANRPRQLNDLRLAPQANDPRPLFVPSAESPRDVDVTRTTEFPKLLFHQQTGEEITVRDREEEDRYLALPEWGRMPPTFEAPDPIETIRAELAGLTEEERRLVLDAQRKSRLDSIQSKLAKLSDAQLADAVDDGQALKARGPGRPKKV